jgi:predicted transcriptional regulator
MDEATCCVLATLVDRYDSSTTPVSVTTLAGALDAEEETVSQRVSRLVACELAAPAAGGYRPTVTGRELLALDVEDGPVIVDLDDCE